MDNACNRPFGNCTPFQAAIGHWRNYPIVPNSDDVELIREQIRDYSLTYDAEEIERIFGLGRLSPEQWMLEATGDKISVQPVFRAVREALEIVSSDT